ncbi:5-(carboxyamino)imidazole ribonucleotide mutase [Candidatus Nitrospira bockiana]
MTARRGRKTTESWNGGRRGHQPLVGVVGGSRSDFPTLEKAVDILKSLAIPCELLVVSAHRTPDRLFAYAEQAPTRGIEVIVAGAGGAAHLPGMLAAKTHLPVIGVPIPTEHLRGLDSLLSIVQMPKGIPVATVAIGGAENAGLLAAQILAGRYPDIRKRLIEFRSEQTRAAIASSPERQKAAPLAES